MENPRRSGPNDQPQKAGQIDGLLRGDNGPLQLGAVFGAHKPAQAAAGEVHPGQRGAEEVGMGQGAVLQRQLLQLALGEPDIVQAAAAKGQLFSRFANSSMQSCKRVLTSLLLEKLVPIPLQP